ncbi:hypothetical protein HAALTHF_41210n [Vreelandella aquamarina]|nr:hypothetical protein HAALTHF_41210n [Halomonas axialensis]
MSVNRRRFLALALGWPAVASATATSAVNDYESTDLVETLLSRAAVPRHSSELWVLIDDKEATLTIFRGNALVERFAPISLGRGGAKTQRIRGDNVTPLGEFRVNRFNFESQWHIFIGIDYPTPPHARMALEKVSTPKRITKPILTTTGVMALPRRILRWVALLGFTELAAVIQRSMVASTGPKGVWQSPMNRSYVWPN